MRWRTSSLVLAAAALLLAALPARAQDGAPTGLALVLLVDASASVTDGGWAFQLRGHAAAFRDPQVSEAIASSPAGRIAVTVARFAGPGTVEALVPWTVVDGPAAASAFADAIDAAPTGGRGGSTAIGSAVDQASAFFATAPGDPPRRVIDIGSNGFSNAGVDPLQARERAEAAGITVNALAILDEFDWLEEYYLDNVVAGFGAFVVTAVDRETFNDAILRKLVAEIADASPAAPARLAAR